MESEDMASESKSMRTLILDWINYLHGLPTHPMRHLFTLSNSLLSLLLLPWKMHPSLVNAM
jgi:hypothetical protein